MTNYPVADLLIRLKNAALAGRKVVSIDKTKLILAVAKTMKKEKFLDKLEEKNGKVIATLSIFCKKPVLSDVTIVSRPGLRIYMNVEDMEKRRSPEILIVSTPNGVMSDRDAIKQRVGGEVIARIL
ncbi:30S ribosomal protein S8 [Candidatus Microgenomates bacterium]|nr:30S ribosomal protein S8 [Candidatus Microgenomates bacterium]